MVSENSVSFKSFLHQDGEPEIRRFTIDKEVVTNFSYLREKLNIVYPTLKNLQHYRVAWKDKDGDMVTICSDEELIIALTEQRSDPVKIHVLQGPLNIPGHSELHEGVVCDNCDKCVKGFRYKCLQCSDFDLCPSCESNGIHSEHFVVRIPHPLNLGAKFAHKMGKKFQKYAHHQQRGWKECEKDGKKSERECPYAKRRSYGGGSCGGLSELLSNLGVADQSQPGTSQQPRRPCSAEDITNVIGAIRQGIASFLDPTGYSAFVNEQRGQEQMDTEEGQGTSQNRGNASQERSGNVSNDRSSGATEQQQSTETEQQGGASARVQTTESAQASAPPQSDSQQAGGDQTDRSSPVTVGWTVVNNDMVEQMENAQSQSTKIKYPCINTAENPGAIPTPFQPQTEPPNSPPKDNVQEALEQMLSMGFNNEGDWLRSLLISNNGRIDQVLDILIPFRRSNSRHN